MGTRRVCRRLRITLAAGCGADLNCEAGRTAAQVRGSRWTLAARNAQVGLAAVLPILCLTADLAPLAAPHARVGEWWGGGGEVPGFRESGGAAPRPQYEGLKKIA